MAIRSTVERLVESFATFPEPVYIGEIRYIDYNLGDMPPGNLFWPIIHKRASYAHEHELRLVMAKFTRAVNVDDVSHLQPPGFEVGVNLAKLIETVYASPAAKTWEFEALQATLARFGLAAPLVQSELDATPLF